jgi:hypothetical protein
MARLIKPLALTSISVGIVLLSVYIARLGG